MGRGRRIVGGLLAVGAVLSALAAPVSAHAQDIPSVTVRVRQVAGANFYLDIGSAHGLATGDTIHVFPSAEDGGRLGQVEVVATSEERSVLSFVGDPFPVSAGDELRLAVLRSPAILPPDRRAEVPGPASRPDEGPASIAGSTAERAHRPAYGRISAEVTGLRSTTRSGGADPIELSRTFATPAFRLDLTVPDAFGGFELRTSARLAYRYSDRDIIDPTASTRIYRAGIRREFDSLPIALELGRLRNDAESYSGYTDGIAIRAGRTGLGVGFLVGFQPDRWNEGLSADRPKATVFMDGERRGDGWRWKGDVSAHLVEGAEGERDRRFIGVSQRLTLGRLTVSHDLQLDQDPDAEAVSVTHLRIQASTRLGAGWTFQGGYTVRHRYSEYLLQPAFGRRSERVRVDLGRRDTGGGLGIGLSTAVAEGRGRVTTYNAYADRSELPGIGLGGQIRGTLTSSDDGTIVSVAPSVSGAAAGGRYRVEYAVYYSDWYTRTMTRHGIIASLSLPVSRQLSVYLQVNGGFSQTLRSGQVRLQLTRAF